MWMNDELTYRAKRSTVEILITNLQSILFRMKPKNSLSCKWTTEVVNHNSFSFVVRSPLPYWTLQERWNGLWVVTQLSTDCHHQLIHLGFFILKLLGWLLPSLPLSVTLLWFWFRAVYSLSFEQATKIGSSSLGLWTRASCQQYFCHARHSHDVICVYQPVLSSDHRPESH